MQYQNQNSPDLESGYRLEINLPRKEVEEKLVQNFQNLRIEGDLLNLFSSFDFQSKQKIMLDEWEKILDYLYKNIFNTFVSSNYDIKKYTIISNTIPTCLNNILQQLRIEKKYIFEKDLNDDKFYQINYQNLNNSNSNGIFSSIYKGISNALNLDIINCGCKDEKDTDREDRDGSFRTDITEEEKNKKINDDTLIFNYEMFKSHCENLLNVIKDYLYEKNVEIVSVDSLQQVLNDNKQKMIEIYDLKYGSQYLDYSLIFLMKTKKIGLFKISLNNKLIKCIKVFKNENDTITENDNHVAKLLIQIESVEKQIYNWQSKIDECEMTKNKLKENDKKMAKKFLKRKNFCEKNLENLRNDFSDLVDYFYSFKNAENNENAKEILENSDLLYKQISDEIDNWILEMKEQK